jgi:hypothetical protein
MSSFQSDLDALADVHSDLLAAVVTTDVERIAPLVARRGDLLASLATTFAAAPRADRESWRPAVLQLACADRELTDCFTSMRDQIAAELVRTSAHAPTAPPELPSGGLNLRA